VSQDGGLNKDKGPGRSSGVLLHITSLAGEFGIGDLGPAAFEWIDTLQRAKQSWWQVLPLGPPGHGYSPYQCYSAFAGNPDLISPEKLVDVGLIDRAEIEGESSGPGRVDFTKIHEFKQRLLHRAWENFSRGKSGELAKQCRSFRSRQESWLEDYALFMAIREIHEGEEFTRWPRALALRESGALDASRRKLSDKIAKHAFTQFLFFRQLAELRSHAKARGIKLIGDLPIFVSPDSADVWANPHLFLLDERRRPRVVAGVPPDYFCKTGQRWGNPLYDWTDLKRTGFDWWVRRVRASLAQCDLLRIDHFRGFDACWQVQASRRTAKTGRWIKSPGRELLTTIRRKIGRLPFIAEDLGLITPAVERLRDEFKLPGMRVLQFAFGGDSRNPFLPHNHVRNSVVYTGTHDNDTVVGWYNSLSETERNRVNQSAPDAQSDIGRAALRMAWSSVADLAIAPVQDLLGLGSEARMNIPGQGSGHWGWRMDDPLSEKVTSQLAELTELFGRSTAS
jgi:4-alpha-glucanotransferase